jgi:hypothetical protein
LGTLPQAWERAWPTLSAEGMADLKAFLEELEKSR